MIKSAVKLFNGKKHSIEEEMNKFLNKPEVVDFGEIQMCKIGNTMYSDLVVIIKYLYNTEIAKSNIKQLEEYRLQLREGTNDRPI